MARFLPTRSKLVVAWLLAMCNIGMLSAQTKADTTFVYMQDGRLHAFPSALVKSQRMTTTMFAITAIDDTEYRYDRTLLDSVSKVGPDSLPRFAEFKFNNKYNDQVYQDVHCDISANHVITASVPCIGKWLTPSFPLYEEDAEVYADGVRQYSKVSRLHFTKPVTYTVTRPGYQVLRAVTNEVEEEPVEPTPIEGEVVTEKVQLTASMLSTNAPTNYPETEDLDKLVDNNPSTYFHSTWGTGAHEKLDLSEQPYIQVQLPEALHKLQISYTNRPDSYDRYVKSFTLQASNNGSSWTDIRTFDLSEDKLPTGVGETFISPALDLGANYTYLRFQENESSYKNYLCLAELCIYKVIENETTGVDEQPGETVPTGDYTIKFVPFGTDYVVNIDFPSDRMTHAPAIYINTEWGIPPYSKTEYMDATFRIDGAGVFPDMEETSVQIRGRGNSSWNTNSYTKNPYRLKFASKVKPFGLTKGKSWVLLSNRQTGSMTSNAIGMKAAQLAGTVAANHIIPVDLYLNDTYWGSYNFTEKVGFGNNSVEVEDETVAAFLELDTYYDEPYKFKPSYYYTNLPVNIKEPDFDDETSGTQITLDDIKSDFTDFVSLVYRKQDISEVCDVDALASFFLVNELILNYELMHPKSTFLYKPDFVNGSKYIWGPVWDLDWSYGYEKNYRYFQSYATADYWTSISMENVAFMRNLRNSGEPLDRAIYTAWTNFVNNHLEELIDFCDEYYEFAKSSLEKNNESGYTDYTDYESTTANAKTWLRQRAATIYATLTPYDIDINSPEQWSDGYSAYTGDEGEELGTGIIRSFTPTLFDVYDMRGVLLKRGASYDTFREGLVPGLYIVNGKKVLIK
ncbi:MAG: CotH kinase family protein [Bacteroidaceae bacterium]|nr:CotH kinase family protein [Bacteroidaceae bacterium]